MFKKIEHTLYPPKKPMLVWDGDCGFCKFWKTRWELKTNGQIEFRTYQEVAKNFPDIPLKEFKKASKLIEPNGQVYNGPDSAYRSLYYSGNKIWHNLYASHKIFQSISDHAYNHIAKNRSFYFKITKIMVGNQPKSLKHFWIFYLLLLIALLYWVL